MDLSRVRNVFVQCRVEKEKWEYPGAVRLGITLLPGGQMDGNSDKTASPSPYTASTVLL